MRQEERRAKTRGALLRAAGSAFADHGYDGSSLDAIAAAADLSKGAVYAHFETKRDLYMAIVALVLDEARRRTETVCESLRAGDYPDVAAGRYFRGDDDAPHISHVTELWQMAVREPAAGEALAEFREWRLEALAAAAVDSGASPGRALEIARMVGKLIDADTLYGRLGDAAATFLPESVRPWASGLALASRSAIPRSPGRRRCRTDHRR